MAAKFSYNKGYLEWNAFARGDVKENDVELTEANLRDNINALSNSDLLIAADVVYDITDLESLVSVVSYFLKRSRGSKQAIFAITKRNMKTFNAFLGHLETLGISRTWLADCKKCGELPVLFPHNFNQPRSHICIASLTYSPQPSNAEDR